MKALIFLCCIYIPTFSIGQSTVFDIITESGDHTIFELLLIHSGVDQLLSGEGNYTVLAPNDEAFRNIYSEEQIDSLLTIASDEIVDLMHFHIIEDDTISDSSASKAHESLYGKDIFIFIDGAGNRLVVGGERPTPYLQYNTDPIIADNGRVHFMTTSIMILPTDKIIEFLLRHPFFSNALGRLNLYNEFLESDEKYTIFWPPIDSIFDSELYTSGALDDLDSLYSFFSAHVIPGHYKMDDLFNGQKISSYDGTQVSIRKIDDTLYVNNAKVVDYCPTTEAVAYYTDTYIDLEWTTVVDEINITTIKFYPNPTSDYLNITNPYNTESCYGELIDIDGRLIKKFRIPSKKTRLNISDLESGIYFISLSSGTTKSIEKILINDN